MTKQLMRCGGVLSEAAQIFLLQVEIGRDGCVSGMLHWMSHEKALHFVGIDQAILMINAWLEEENPLPAELTLRSFKAGRQMRPAFCSSDQQNHAEIGRCGNARRKESLLVYIIRQEHTSWQGEVRWKSQKICFRSTLELMCLVYSALNSPKVIGTADESISMPKVEAV